jgi:hypothetical protein
LAANISTKAAKLAGAFISAPCEAAAGAWGAAAATPSPFISFSISAPGSGSSEAWMRRSNAISAACNGMAAAFTSPSPFRSSCQMRWIVA